MIIGRDYVSVASLDLAVLKVVGRLSDSNSTRITFGQIYMQLVRCLPNIPSIAECVVAVDVLVKEGLQVSQRVLDEYPAFPYTQHIISGLTDIGAASLKVNV